MRYATTDCGLCKPPFISPGPSRASALPVPITTSECSVRGAILDCCPLSAEIRHGRYAVFLEGVKMPLTEPATLLEFVQVFESLITSVAILLGGGWAFFRFFLRREHIWNVEVTKRAGNPMRQRFRRLSHGSLGPAVSPMRRRMLPIRRPAPRCGAKLHDVQAAWPRANPKRISVKYRSRLCWLRKHAA
jgi:hypothetical protein